MNNDNEREFDNSRIKRRKKRGKYRTPMEAFFCPIYEKGFLFIFFIYEIFDILVRFCEPFLFRFYSEAPELYEFIVIEIDHYYKLLRFFPEIAFVVLYIFIIRDRLELTEKKIYNNYFMQYYAMHYLTLEIEKNFLYGIYKRICVYPNANFCLHVAGYCMAIQILFCLDCMICILLDRYVHIQIVSDSVFVQIGDKRKYTS